MEPRLARIRIHPIKSLDPLELHYAGIASGTSLAGDREYALFDSSGSVLNTKRLGPALLKLRAEYAAGGREVSLTSDSLETVFRLPDEVRSMAQWLSGRLGQAVNVRRNPAGGFPDDSEASGPTLVGTASLQAVSRHFGLSLEEVRRRFRTNLEIEGLEPFEVDLLYGLPGEPRPFRLGSVELLGTNPCRRCSVPTRDSYGNEARGPLQPRSFAEFRTSRTHPGSHLESYRGYYRFAVNTLLAEGQDGRSLRVGDRLELPAPEL